MFLIILKGYYKHLLSLIRTEGIIFQSLVCLCVCVCVFFFFLIKELLLISYGEITKQKSTPMITFIILLAASVAILLFSKARIIIIIT